MKYRVLEPATFGPGARLTLTEDQAAPRRHVLMRLSGDLYETTDLVQFKAGEVLGVQGDLPKSLQAILSDTEKPLAAEKLAKKAAK
jgi:hypothetical protein